MAILYLKAFHIVGFVAWFAGLFYLVRIFVYHTEAEQRESPAREILIKEFNLMEWRVFKIIVNPGMMITFTCGIGMLVLNPAYLQMGWLHLKLTLLFLLLGYHMYCKRIILSLENGTNKLTSFQFRLLNEVPTLFLVSIVLLAVLRNNLEYFFLFVLVFVLAISFYVIAKMYKRHREKE